MTNHFYVIDPKGNAHTRSSASRVYTHTVLVRVGRAAVDRYYAAIEQAGVQAGESYDRTVRHSQGIFPQNELWRGEKVLQFWKDHAIKFLADPKDYGKGRDAVVAAAIARATKNAQDYEASGWWDRFHNAGWCSRRDLAQKLAASTIGENVIILEAQVGKPPKGTPKA